MRKFIGLAALALGVLAPAAAASAHNIQPEVDCVQPTQYGYVAHFTYTASSLSGGDEFIAAGDNLSGPEGNILSVSGVGTQGNGQQPWTETFVDGTHQQGFQVYFRADGSATWTVRIDNTNRSATATANSVRCPGGADGQDGQDGQDGADGQDGQDGAPGLPGPGVVVTAEPAGENCPAGGVKLTVVNGFEPQARVVNEGDVFYVCNGVNGTNGTNGTNGADGSNGTDGQRGLAPAAKSCTSKRLFKMTLAPRFKGAKRVWLTVAGKERLAKVTKGKVLVNFQGKPRGMYAVIVRKNGIKRQKRIYTLCAAGNVSAYNVVPAKA